MTTDHPPPATDGAALPHCIVTRPVAQAAGWVQALQALGLQASALPLIGIAALDDDAALRSAWAALPAQALVMFVSANAVQHFFAARPPGMTWPVAVLAGSTGPGTSAALLAAGVPAGQLVAPAEDATVFDTETLWATRLQALPWAGRQVLVVRGEDGRDWLADTLRGHGAEVDFVAAYRRLPPRLDAAGQALLAAAQATPAGFLWLFSSSEAVQHLRDLAPATDWAAARALASHPRIADSARQAGFGSVLLTPPHPEAVAAALRAGGAPGAPQRLHTSPAQPRR
jgi:uroporphyrinogen-III synthase